MSEFIFMLTHHDATVPDPLRIYRDVRTTRLAHVGFKDIGVPARTLHELTRRMHEDGRTVYLEVVSTTPGDELRSMWTAVELGVDVVMGGTHCDDALAVLAGTGIRYFPFPGRVVGHPSVLEGSVDEIAASAAELIARGVDGLDVLAYRHATSGDEIVAAVVSACRKPVVVAGSIADEARIRAVTEHGAWGFTIGGAIMERALPAGPTIRDQVEWVLATAEDAALRAAPELATRSARGDRSLATGST
jgi:hypothetical protein